MAAEPYAHILLERRTVTVQANFSYQASFGSKGRLRAKLCCSTRCVAMQRYLRAETK